MPSVREKPAASSRPPPTINFMLFIPCVLNSSGVVVPLARRQKKSRIRFSGVVKSYTSCAIGIVPVIAFAGFVVVPDQTDMRTAVEKAVFERVPGSTNKFRQEPKLHFGYPIIIQSLAMQNEDGAPHMTDIVIC